MWLALRRRVGVRRSGAAVVDSTVRPGFWSCWVVSVLYAFLVDMEVLDMYYICIFMFSYDVLAPWTTHCSCSLALME